MRGIDVCPTLLALSLLSGVSCAPGVEPALQTPENPSCAPKALSRSGQTTGVGLVFVTDPMSSSGNPYLHPQAEALDQYAVQVPLSHLFGSGVLDGQYVSIRNRIQCNDGFGAFDMKHQFIYPHSDFRFQEAMSYYYGDQYQSRLAANGYLISKDPVVILAHCESVDNSYFTKAHDVERQIYNGREFNEVCLGDSNYTPGAFYADDAQVVIHELQHAATVDNYSPNNNLNQFFYDEAGGLNEGISDFMSLAFSDNIAAPSVGVDAKLFSRWALGTFNQKPNHSSVRGAHRCPMYDSSFPNCTSYPAFGLPSDSNGSKTTISYVYPDGLGWPFPNNYKSQNILSSIYQSYVYDEEIHNDDLIITGALWDLYSALKQNRGGDGWAAFNLSQKLVLEGVRHLPAPNAANRSPVTFIKFASTLMDSISLVSGLTPTDRTSIQQVLKDRGLYQMQTLQSADWVAVGPGTLKLRPHTLTPGVFIQDNPQILTKWLTQMGVDTSILSQVTSNTQNSMLDPGEIAVIWFDLQNNQDLTAGGVLLTVTSPDPDLEILDDSFNLGFNGGGGQNQAQVMYAKVNGKAMGETLNTIVATSSGNGVSFSSPGNTYFTTNPLFGLTYRTGVWVKVSAAAEHGKEVGLQVQAVPANGSALVQSQPITLTFPVKIQ